MEIWVSGWFLAVCIGVYKLGAAVSNANNQAARNMRKLGAHYSLFGGGYTAKSAPTMAAYAWAGVYQLLIGPLFSWLAVISSAIGFIRSWRIQAGLPEKIREITYRLRTLDLTHEQMLVLDAQTKSFHAGRTILPEPAIASLPEVEFLGGEDDTVRLTVSPTKDDHSSLSFEINRSGRTFELTYKAFGDEDSSRSELSGEYRVLADGKVEWRITDDVLTLDFEEVPSIADGRVLEEGYRQRQGRFSTPEEVEAEIDNLRASTQWHEIESLELRYFVVLCHSDIITPSRAHEIVRSEVRRIESAVSHARLHAPTINCTLIEDERGYDFAMTLRNEEDSPYFNEGQFDRRVMESVCGATYAEIRKAKKIASQLQRYIEPKTFADKAA